MDFTLFLEMIKCTAESLQFVCTCCKTTEMVTRDTSDGNVNSSQNNVTIRTVFPSPLPIDTVRTYPQVVREPRKQGPRRLPP